MTAEWESAIRQGDVEAVRRMLHGGIDVNARDDHGQTGLMIAACQGWREVVRTLLEAGAALDHTAKYGLSAVMLAVINGHAEIVQLLADAGADLAIRGSGAPGFAEKTASDLAEAQRRADLVAILRRSP